MLLLRSKLLCTRHHSAASVAASLQCAFLPPILRLLSTTPSSSSSSDATTQNTPSKRQLLEQYLVNSCGFSPAQATRAAKHIPCETSVSNPKSVVQFLKQNGLDLTRIRTAVLRDPRLLLLDVKTTLKPQVDALQRLGFSLSDSTQLFYLHPSAFRCNFSSLQQRTQFWMPIVGSVENLLHLLKKNRYVLSANLDKVIVPNLHFLQKRCGLSGSQIVNMSASKLLTGNPKNVKEIVKRAMEYGKPCFLHVFKNILRACSLKPQKIKSTIESLMRVGWSELAVLSMIRKQPNLLQCSEEILLSKVNFLTKDAGMDPAFVVANPILLTLSMNKRLVPRHRVLMKLKVADLPDGRRSYYGVVRLPEQKFLDDFVFPNLGIIPDLYGIYTSIAGEKLPAKRGLNDQAEILRALQFSYSEVSNIIRKESKLVTKSREQMCATVDFLIAFVGLSRSYIAAHPKILTYSLEQRLIPRYYALKCLEVKGLVRNNRIMSVMGLKETDFMEQFISSYKDSIPGLAENYESACAGRALKFEHKYVQQETQTSCSPK